MIAACLLAAVHLILAPVGGNAAAEESAEQQWRELLQRAAGVTHRSYTGEVLTVSWSDGAQGQATLSSVRNHRGDLMVEAAEGYTVKLGRRGGGLSNHDEGWFVPLPGMFLPRGPAALAGIEEKYDIDIAGQPTLLGRTTVHVTVTRRADSNKTEELWLDEQTGLVLRRQSYDGDGALVRLAAFLSIDLTPDVAGPWRPAKGERSVPLVHRAQEIIPISARRLTALREAGWSVPESLPGGYEAAGAYAVSAADAQPLQLVYRDGLYTVSLFQQRGQPDPGTLPTGAQQAEWTDWPAYEWPGAVPRRLVWEAEGTTYTLVADAPREEFEQIAAALPRPAHKGVVARLADGLGRIGRWLSPWH